MAVEVIKPVLMIPKHEFKGLKDLFDMLNKDPQSFDYHAHVPIKPGQEEDAEWLRHSLLKIKSPLMQVSMVWDPPKGPHINYPYFSAYFPGKLLEEVKHVVENNHGEVSVMIHPVTGMEYAEHFYCARWTGPKVTEALHDEMLKDIDRDKGFNYVGL